MKLDEAIARLRVALARGIPSDDDRYSDRYIYSEFKTTRALAIYQKLNKYHSVSQYNYNTIDCLELELGQYSDCPCYTDDCYILRSVNPLPEIVSYKDGLAIEGVYTINGKEITYMQQKKSKFKEFRRTGHKDLFYFIHNDYLYVLGSTKLKVVSMTAVFVDPTELADMEACEDPNNPVVCYDPYAEDFPIDEELFNTIESMILAKHMQYDERMEVDNENNARDTQITNERE